MLNSLMNLVSVDISNTILSNSNSRSKLVNVSPLSIYYDYNNVKKFFNMGHIY